MSVLGSEMRKVTAEYSGNADSMEALTAKSKVYASQADEQRNKIDAIKKALENATKEYGENSNEVKDWQIKLNNAETDLIKTEAAIKETSGQIEDFGKKAKKSGDDAVSAGGGWEKFGKGLADVGVMAAKAMAALTAAAAAAATAVGAMTIKAAQAADDINTLAAATGLSVEEIQKFQYATEVIDVSMSTLTGSLTRLIRNMNMAQGGTGEAAKAFEALGINITDSTGALRNNQDVFNEAITALGKIENATQRDAYAMAMFGKSAQELNPLILGGAEALKELGDEAEAAGLILSQETLDATNELSDAMDTLKASATMAGHLFATVFADPMADAVNTLKGYLHELTRAFADGGIDALAEKMSEVLSNIIADVTEFLPKMIDFGMDIINKIIQGILENASSLVAGAVEIFNTLSAALIDLLPQILDVGIQAVLELIHGITETLPTLIPLLIDGLMSMVQTIVDNLAAFQEAGFQLIKNVIIGIINALPGLIDALPEILDGILDFFTSDDSSDKLSDAGAEMIGALFSNLPKIMAAIGRAARSIINVFTLGIPDFVDEMMEKMFGPLPGKAQKTATGADAQAAALVGVDGNETTQEEKAQIEFIKTVSESVKSGSVSLAEVATTTAKTHDTVKEISTGMVRFSTDIDDVIKQIGVDANDTVQEYTKKIMDKIEENTRKNELIAEATEATKRILERQQKEVWDANVERYMAPGSGYIDFGNGNISWIGNNASGTDFWRGGWSWVGENGPELLKLPRGSQIKSAEESKQLGDVTIIFQNPVESPYETARTIKKTLQQLAY